MKNLLTLISLYLIMMFYDSLLENINFINVATAKEYCIPPKYYTGPYTGIVNFSLESLNNTTEFSDGYADFSTSRPSVDLTVGATDSISIDLYYDPSMLSFFEGNLNVRVWIDWNGDFDFEDEDEEAIASVKNCSGSTYSNPNVKFTADFTIPSTAKLGLTRLRVYEDMAESDGHITPNPCGYLNSNNGLGQHGECEDYSVNIINSTGVEIPSYEIALDCFPNPTSDWLNIYLNKQTDVIKVNLYNLLGMMVYSNHFINRKSVELYLGELERGFYTLRISTNEIDKFIKLIKE